MSRRLYLAFATLGTAALLGAAGCVARPAPVAPAAAPEADRSVGAAADVYEVVVSSIDPPPPRPGPALRDAGTVLARAAAPAEVLGGFVAAALTGDDGAAETVVRGLADPERCHAAASAIAFLPAAHARRPLWLALRLDCAAAPATWAAAALRLDAMVEAARSAGDLAPGEPPAAPPPAIPAPAAADACGAETAALRGLPPLAATLPPDLAGLDAAPWALPDRLEDLCSPPVLAAALRLRRGDAAARLALDLRLGGTDELAPHLAVFVDRFGLGAATPRLADHVHAAGGLVCHALIDAGRLDVVASAVTDAPQRLPACLDRAVETFADRAGPGADAALDAVARASRAPGCARAALAAAAALRARGARLPRWTTDPTSLGSAVAATLDDPGAGTPDSAALRRLRATAFALRGAADARPRPGEPVAVYQRDLRSLVPVASGPRRLALERLLEEGRR
jgi:hypothetical protein